MKDICSECGDRKVLNDRGVCQNRFGCEHRQFQHRARTERLLAEMDQQEWHNRARQHHLDFTGRYGVGGWAARYRHPSNQPPLAGGSDQMNRWIDDWLGKAPPEDED